MKSRTIVFALESFFPENSAGTEIYVLNLCLFLVKTGWQVHVIIPTKNNNSEYIYRGIPVHTFPIPKDPLSTELNGIIPPRGLDSFIKLVIGINPGIVHFHTLGRAINSYHLKTVKNAGFLTVFTSHLATIFCTKGDLRYCNATNCINNKSHLRCSFCLFKSRKSSFPLLASIMHSIVVFIPLINKLLPPSIYRISFKMKELSRVRKYADKVFALLPWMVQLYSHNKIQQTILVPQALPEDFSGFLNSNQAKDDDCLTFGYVGRMHPIKGYDILYKAFIKLPVDKVKLVVITMEEHNELEYFLNVKSQCSKMQNIEWHENISRSSQLELMMSFDILVIPSRVNETGPLSLLEASELRIPVMASGNLGILDQVIPGVNGIVYDMNSDEALYDEMERLLNDRSILDRLKEGIKKPIPFENIAGIMESNYFQLIESADDSSSKI